MSDLITRAEQGVLAAMLTGHRPPWLTERLSAADFTDPIHQVVYEAILDLQATTTDPDRLAITIAAVHDDLVDLAWLRDLAAHAPEPERASTYAQILLHAAFDRDTAGFADAYLTAADLATDDTSRERLTRLGQALTLRAEAFTSPETTAAAQTPEWEAPERALHPQDQVIADLLQHPEQAGAVAAWLDSAVFTTEQRRLAFEIAVSIAYDHDPIDAVILTWHVEQARAIANLDEGPPQLPDPGGEPDYTYLSRLERTPVEAGTAVLIGRQLLTDHVQATLTATASTISTTATAAAEPEAARDSLQPSRQARTQPPLTPAPQVDIRPIER